MAEEKIDWSIGGKLSFVELKEDCMARVAAETSEELKERAEIVAETEIVFSSAILIEQLKSQDAAHIERISRSCDCHIKFPLIYTVKFEAEDFVEPYTKLPNETLTKPKSLPIEVNIRLKTIILDWMKNRKFSQAEYYWAFDCVKGHFLLIIRVDSATGDTQELTEGTSTVTFY